MTCSAPASLNLFCLWPELHRQQCCCDLYCADQPCLAVGGVTSGQADPFHCQLVTVACCQEFEEDQEAWSQEVPFQKRMVCWPHSQEQWTAFLLMVTEGWPSLLLSGQETEGMKQLWERLYLMWTLAEMSELNQNLMQGTH